MAEVKRQEVPMETTESYRGPVREVSNVERLYTPANDNRPKTRPRSKKQVSRTSVPRAPLKGAALQKLGGLNPQAQKGVAVAMAGTATYAIIAGTAILYPVQFVMAALTLGGLAALVTIDTTWIGYADIFGWFSDFGAELLFISLMIVFVIGVLTFFVAVGVFVFRGVNINRGISIIVAAVCLALYATPLLNFVPWIWLWCLYVVKSQADE